MMNSFSLNRNRIAEHGDGLPHSNRAKKLWLMGRTSITPIAKGDTTSRWLLPYADFLTVLFCITLLWCGLALKQAHWLQIQNGKLEQALEQASQQLVITNQALESQTALVQTLQKPTVSVNQPIETTHIKLQPENNGLPNVPQSRVKQPPQIGQQALLKASASPRLGSIVR